MTGFNAAHRNSKPQPDMTPTAAPYPHSALPRLIREAVECAVVRDQVPIATYSTVANASITLAVEGLAVLKRRNGRLVPLSMSYLVVSPPATGKSTAFRTCFAPMAAQDKIADAAYKKSEKEYPFKLADWKKQRVAINNMIGKKQSKGEPYDFLQTELELHLQRMPVKPREQNWLITDMTGASFVERSAGNNQSFGIACGEGAITFRYLYDYLAFLNLAWDGDNITTSRKGTGTTVGYDTRIMTLILTQPDVFNAFRSTRNDLASGMGAWARFLPVLPPRLKTVLTSGLDATILTEALNAFLARLAELVAERERRVKAGITTPDIIELDSDADARLAQFHSKMKTRGTDGDLVDVGAFAIRASEHAERLAAAFSYFCGELKITLDMMERAISVIEYHLEAYISCFSLKNTVPDVQLQAEDLEKHLQRRYWIHGCTGVHMTHIEKHGPSKELRNVAVLVPALKWLEARGKIRLLPRGRTYYIQYVPQ